MVREPSDARRSAVLLEEIRSEVRKVAEGHEVLAQGINRLETSFGELRQRFMLMEQALGKLVGRSGHLWRRLMSKRWGAWLRVLAVGTFLANGFAWAEDQRATIPQIIQSAQPTVVMVQVEDGAGNVLGFGSGFFVSTRGVIATNLHVLEAEGDTINVKLSNGKILPAELIDVDIAHDVATLRVEGSSYPTAKLSSNDNVHVGEQVVAIGHPLGLENTVSTGIISAVRQEDHDTVLQITAPISPGNSGGPLLNLQGEVVGLNTATILEGQNLNFAIPIRYVRPLIHDQPNPHLAKLLSEAYGEDENLEEVVYVTSTGTHYHRQQCQFLSQSALALTKGEARKNGYSPCSVCNP